MLLRQHACLRDKISLDHMRVATRVSDAYTPDMNATIRASHHVFAIDCPDAQALAKFYSRLLGWQIETGSDDGSWVELVPPEGEKPGFSLAFQQVDHYRMPEWPEGEVPQQAHLDFHVDSLEESGAVAVAAGATKHPIQPGEGSGWVVYKDPAGHLFCLCQA